MRAVVCASGGELAVEEVPDPTPEADQLVLRVSRCGICGTDMHIFHGAMDQRVSMPQIIGHEVSATVAEIGDGVTNVSAGDRVAVRPLFFGEPTAFDKGHSHVGKNLKFMPCRRCLTLSTVVWKS